MVMVVRVDCLGYGYGGEGMDCLDYTCSVEGVRPVCLSPADNSSMDLNSGSVHLSFHPSFFAYICLSRNLVSVIKLHNLL